MIFDIINPSDACTLEADDFEVAAIAGFFLGAGRYGLRQLDGERELEMPILMFGADSWFQQMFGRSFEESMQWVTRHCHEELTAALDSVVYGDAADRLAFVELTRSMTPEWRTTKRREWNEARRSSMNDIGKQARVLVQRLRAKLREAV